MHAIVVNVTINDREAATDHLRNEVVPGVGGSVRFFADLAL